MLDFEKMSRSDLEFVAEMMFVFYNGDETHFEKCGINFGIDYKDNKIWVYEDKASGRNYYFSLPEDFFEVFLTDGKQPFLDKLNAIATLD